MKKLALILAAGMLLLLCACGTAEQTAQEPPSDAAEVTGTEPAAPPAETPEATADESAAEPAAPGYPYEDDQGRTHYQLYINGELVETQHDPYTYAEEPDGAFYPIVEVLKALGVECLFDSDLMQLTTRLNGQVITCGTGDTDIVVGKTTLGGTAPEYVDDCFYVPSYTFMQLLDATVDFTPDRSGVTLTTDTVVDPGTSGVAGLSLSSPAGTALGEQKVSGAEACASCHGTGRAVCTFCSGTGSITQFLQTRDPITGQMTIHSTHTSCSRCGGSGYVTCSACGGSGRR